VSNELNSLSQRIAEELVRYTQFLLAIAGAAIAYALDQSQGKPLTRESVALLLALIFWCGSFYFGICHLRQYRQHMIENAKALLQDETFERMQQRLNPFVNNMEIASNLQYLLFFLGVLSYIAWYILEAINA
jgi:hypothetical protein